VRAAPPSQLRPVYSNHRLHDVRSLALHALIGAKIERDPALLKIARSNLTRWRKRFKGLPNRWWTEWEQLLRRPWPQVAALLTDPGEQATRLRQSSPFAGILTAVERRRIYDAFRT
jgi:hypothetical protein